MKNSYKLVGKYWDGKHIPNIKPNIFKYNKNELDRIKTVSEIFRLKDDELENQKLSEFDFVIVDYIPSINSEVVFRFYTKRLLQIVKYSNSKLVCNDIEKVKKLNEYLDLYYKNAS